MENDNRQETSQWVMEQTAYLDPPADWRPDPTAARAGFHARKRARRRRMWLQSSAVAAALVAALVLLAPVARVRAQQLWQFLTVRRVTFIRVNAWPEGVPSPKVSLIGDFIPPLPARGVADAQWRVHYEPRMPRQAVLSGNPRFSTTFGLSGGAVIKVADLQLALRKAGVMGVTVPPQWDGAQLALHTSGVVIAEWPDAIFAQSLPLTLSAPPGFDFPAFSALVLRVLGVGPDEARRLAERMGTTPSLLAPIDPELERRGTIEEVELDSGPATLVQWKDEKGAVERTTLVWSVPDRVYAIDGKLSRELAIAMAEAVPRD